MYILIILLLCIFSSYAMEHDNLIVPIKSVPEYTSIPLKESGEIPKSIEDKKFVLTKIKIASLVTIAVTLIGAGVTVGIQYAQCEK
jgi:hypothetical protein